MKFNNILFISLLVLLISLSLSSISASEDVVLNDTLGDSLNSVDLNKNSEMSAQLEGVDSNQELLSDESQPSDSYKDYEVYVGANDAEDGGNGSKENPYATFNLACSNIVNGKNVTINVLEGTHYIDSVLTFDAINLHIKGIGNNVIIKNKYNVEKNPTRTSPHPEYKQCLSSNSLVGNFSLSNVIVDGTNWYKKANTEYSGNQAYLTYYFLIFYNGKDSQNNIKFNNCTFNKYALGLLKDYNAIYNITNCIFNYDYSDNTQYPKSTFVLGYGQVNFERSVNFKNCIFNIKKFGTQSFSCINSSKCNLIDCWFGQNSLPFYFYMQSGANIGEFCGVTINRYAVFSVYEEKIDDNTYDIIGKLMWNDSTIDGIENLSPMTVTLTSVTGEIPATATLENGTFKVRYTTTSKEHNITVKLDSQELNLTFNYNVDINAESKPIYYGKDQNITINLPYNATGVINLVFEDETSEELEITNVSSFNYTIKKTLKVGNNKINISLIDNNAHSYGSTVLNYEVLKINEYKFDVNAPENVTIGDNITVTVELPEDAKGNVTIFIGKNNFTKEVNGNIVKIDVNGFKVGENEIKINYTGDDVYDKKSLNKIITAKKVETKVNETTLVDETPSNSDKPTFTINLHEDATGNFTVTINGKNYTKELVNGSATIVIEDLPKGEYNATLTYSGDDKYDRIIKNTTVSVKEVTKQTASSNKDTSITSNKVVKKATKITAKKKTFKAKLKVKKYTITLKAGKKPIKKVKVTIKIGKKTYSAKTNAKGKATFKIKKLTKKGKYTAVIKFKGNRNYKPISKKVKITIKK